jgi:hypothetical protein
LNLILDLHALLEDLDGLDRPMILERSANDTTQPPPRPPLPLLDRAAS